MKPKARTAGHVDGSRGPRSDDLSSELPDLLAMLGGRLDSVGRLMYDLAAGPKAPARLATGGRSVRLEGFTCRPANTLEVLGVDRKKESFCCWWLRAPIQTLHTRRFRQRRRQTTRPQSAACPGSARGAKNRRARDTDRHFTNVSGGFGHDSQGDTSRRGKRQVLAVR
ncbi:DUF5994 family protein [Mycobacterium sp. 050134]|uniref:DUF5994 family protein n=1 Tax=Mycobacterium sp. 050134 TaxID=3096111 RepID=UPI002ED79441